MRDSHRNINDEALRRDLELVLPGVRRCAEAKVTALVAGREASVESALARAVELIDASVGPTIAGLSGLSIESAREAVALAEAMRGRLIGPSDTVSGASPVTQTATLGHVLACEFVVWVTPTDAWLPQSHALAQRIASRVGRSVEVAATAEAVGSVGDEARHCRRVAVVLHHDVDARVASLWHRWAARAQEELRVCVVVLPDLSRYGNTRGVSEVVTWQTGQTLLRGGVDFADGGPRPCGAGVESADVIIDAGLVPVPREVVRGRRVIRVGAESDAKVEVSFVIPGLALGLAARVMRFDGVVLWLCGEGEAAPADPAVELLATLARRVKAGGA